MAVRVHVASHPDALVARLCDQLAHPAGDPFAPELVAVPSRGIERWLTQQIASGLGERGAGDGICANVEFPSPTELVRRTLATVAELGRSAAAWEGPVLTAHLLDTIDHRLSEPWMGLLAHYLDHDGAGPSPNRLAAAEKIARLFTRYSRRRPAMIRAWSVGEDIGPHGNPLGPANRWQPQLWRALRERIGEPSLPEILPKALDPIRAGDTDLDLPERIAVYGLTSTDPLDLAVLVALGARREVHLYVLHPSPGLWAEARPDVVHGLGNRADDPTVGLAAHPLLKVWGRDSRELQTVLAAANLTSDDTEPAHPAPTTLLGRIQSDIRSNAEPAAITSLAASDRSVQIHVCHGTRRQAEVLRDAILHILVSDPTLQPRDIVIMTPDLTTFAPLLEAAFPRGDTGGLPDLRLRIADRSPSVRNPLVGFAANLLATAGGRLEADVVRELVGRPVVQNKFGFDADTAGAVAALVDDSHIAWGLDQDHRRQWGVGGTDERTWRRGLDRALSGVFYSDSPVRTVGDISPLGGVEGQDAFPAGLMAAILDRLLAIRRRLSQPRPLSEWAGVVAESVRLLAAPAWDEDWQLDQLERLLAETFPAPEPGGADPAVSLGEARLAVASWADDRPSPLHFRTGDITVCTLVPMRSVPYRVVCLLGMDETRFPRRGRIDGDDLLDGHELVGDRDAATMDRQLLLDAVMAAGDHLVVTYSGRDELSNTAIPPAVPIAELTDAIGEMVGDEVLDRSIRTTHPLQSFSAANFTPATLGVAGPWGFDPIQHQGALAIQNRITVETTPVVWPAVADDAPIRLTELIRFLQDPVGRFVRSRLGFSIPEMGDIPDDTIPADLNALSNWAVTDRLLTGLVGGHEPDALIARERGNDAVPPGDLGGDDLQRAMAAATTLWEAARQRDYEPRRHQPVAGVVTAGGRMVEGTVTIDPEREHLFTVTPSRIKGKQRLDAFTRLVFVSALRPDVAWQAITLGRRSSGDKHVAVTVGPLTGNEATRHQRALELMGGLVDLYIEGQARPLPMPCETAYQWQRNGGEKERKARWRAGDAFVNRFGGDSADFAHTLVLPDLVTFDALERAGFADYCARLWLPILALVTEKNI